jgi:serine protease Do
MSFLEDPMFRRFFGEPRRSRDIPVQNLGSGVIVTEDGYILTNNHVVEGADKIQVVLSDGKREFAATLVGTDPQTDVAVLKVDAKDLPAITFGNSDHVEVGDVVFALGNPRGVGQSVSMGIVSGLGRATGILGREGYEDFIQTDAAINRGNSGGPLVDIQGRLIGVNQSIASSSGGSEGVGFAIPVNLARNVIEQLVTSGTVQRGYIGVNIQPLTPDLSRSFNIDDGSGALVSDVVEDSPAAEAGLQPGDVIVQFGKRKVEDSSSLRLMASQTPPGTQVDLKIVRDGKGIERTITLAQLPGDLASVEGSSGPRSLKRDSLDGVGVEDLTRELRRQINIPSRVEGALVTEVEEGSNAYRAGLRAGDVIVGINHSPVASSRDAVRLSDDAKGDQILLRVWSNQGGSGGLRYLVVDNRKND